MILLRECDMLHFCQPDRASLPRGPIDEPVLPMRRRCAAPDEAAMVASRGILALSVRCAEGPRSRAFRFISAQLGEWSRKLCRAAVAARNQTQGFMTRCDIGDCSPFPMLEVAAYDILKVQAAVLESGRRCGRVQMRA
jgi:hypothetical protein